MIHICEPAIACAKHHRHVPNQNFSCCIYVISFSVLNIYVYGRCISHVSNPTLMRCDLMTDTVLFHDWHPDSNVSEFEVKLAFYIIIAIRISSYYRVCFDNLLDFRVDEEIIRINMLFDKSP